jgi:tetratricopeptide (TPR) repeat protein
MNDLEEAITCYRQALALLPHGHLNNSCSLNNLASAVSTRFKQLGRMEDLEEAITCHNQALALLPHEHPNRSSSLNDLANAMFARFGQSGRMDDLEKAITCHRQALTLRPHGNPNRSSSLNNLANAVLTRFEQLRSNEDLLDAVKYLSEAKTILPTGHPRQLTIVSSLAAILLIQCDNNRVSKRKKRRYDENLRMINKAFELFEQAADHSPASAKDRFDTAVRWARVAHRRDHPSAVHAYTKSLTLLGCRLTMAPTIEFQQNLLATVPKALALMPLPVPSIEENLGLRSSYWNKGGLYYGQNCEVIDIHSTSFVPLIKSFMINSRP